MTIYSFNMFCFYSFIRKYVAQAAEVVEYTHCFSAEG